MSAYLGAAISKGALDTQRFVQNKPERDARRAEATARQQKAKEYINNEPLRKSNTELAIEQSKTALKQLHSSNLQSSTFQSFDKYEGDGDIRHLKNFIADAKKNPAGQRMYAGMATVDKITRTPQTEAQLTQQGITDLDGFFENPDKHGNFVLATSPEGEQTVVNLDDIYKSTGYSKYASSQALEAVKTRQTTAQLASFGISYKDMDTMTRAATMIKEEMNIPLHEAIRLLTDAKAKNKSNAGGSSVERTANLIMEAEGIPYLKALDKAVLKLATGNAQSRESKQDLIDNPGKSRSQAMSDAKSTVQSNTGKQKNMASADAARDQLDELGGGSFFDADLTDRATHAKASRLVTKLEEFSGAKFSQSDKIASRKLKKVLSLADPATELSEDETGIFDNLLHGVKQYLTDNVDGVQATTAYETIRNAVRHDLFGATLPDGEIRAFNKSLGGLGKQLGPVLQQLKGTMETTMHELQAIYDTNDEMVAQFYLGTSLDNINGAIDNLGKRIDSLQVDQVKELKITPKKTLDQILFPGGKQ